MLLAQVTIESVIALLTPLAVIVAGIVNYITASKAAAAAIALKNDLKNNQMKIDTKLDTAARKTAEVKTDLATSQGKINDDLKAIKSTGEITHALVNARMGAVLKSVAEMSRRIADMTKFPEDIAAAEAAAEISLDHEKKQRIADAK